MQVSTIVGPVTVLSITGDIDSNTFRELSEEVQEVLNQGHINLVLDLHGVNYISSGGIVALQNIVGRAATLGGRAVLSGLTRRVAQVIELTGFSRRLSIYSDVTEANASFSQT